jgi:hypothetical protein
VVTCEAGGVADGEGAFGRGQAASLLGDLASDCLMLFENFAQAQIIFENLLPSCRKSVLVPTTTPKEQMGP